MVHPDAIRAADGDPARLRGDAEPAGALGERQVVVTYMIKDRAGMIRGRGLNEAQAHNAAKQLAEDDLGGAASPFSIERITYTAFTHSEVVAQVRPLSPEER